ncbi:proline-rich protein 36-like [Penaeus japonicus]|uniref:proline-rich protein 36-like n=1 Tax=Penaeus japonicus TaxID=27405 RepID=UPI001C715D05|nr:proline-rich protein 36-like [Penaeus japonicus]
MGGLGWILPFSLINGLVAAVSVISHAGSGGGEGYRKLTSPIDILKNLDTANPSTDRWQSEFQPLKRVSTTLQSKFPESTLPPPASPLGSEISFGADADSARLQGVAAALPPVSSVSVPSGFLRAPAIVPGDSVKGPRALQHGGHIPEGALDPQKEAGAREERELFVDKNLSLEIEPSASQVERATFGTPFGAVFGTPFGTPGAATSRQLRPPRGRRPRRGPQRPQRGPVRRPSAGPPRQRPPRHPDISIIPLQPLETDDNSENLLSLRFPPYTNDFPPFIAPPPTPSPVRDAPLDTPVAPFSREPPSPFIASFTVTTPFPEGSTLPVASPLPPESFAGAPVKPAGEDAFRPQAPRQGFGQRTRFPAPPALPRPAEGPRRQRKPGSARQPKAVLLADGPVGGSRQLKKEAKRPRGKAPTGPFGRRIRPSDRASSLSSVWAAFQHVFQSSRG